MDGLFGEGDVKMTRTGGPRPVITEREWDATRDYVRNKVDALDWKIRGRLDSLLGDPARRAVLDAALDDIRKDTEDPDLTAEQAWKIAHGPEPPMKFAVALGPHVRRAVEGGARIDVRQMDKVLIEKVLNDPKCPLFVKEFREARRSAFDIFCTLTKWNPQLEALLRTAVVAANEGQAFDRVVMRHTLGVQQLTDQMRKDNPEAAEWDRRMDEEGRGFHSA